MNDDRPSYPAKKARGGEIIPRRRWQRIVFIAGLAAIMIIAIVVRLLMMRGR